MIKCQVCGYENPDDATVCLNCGAPIDRPKQSAAMDDISEEQTLLLSPPPKGDGGRQWPGAAASQQPSHASAGGEGGQGAPGPVPPPPPPPPAAGPSGGGPQHPGLPPLGATEPMGPPPGAHLHLILNVVIFTTILVFAFVSGVGICCLPVAVIPVAGCVFGILAVVAGSRGDFAGAHSQVKIAKICSLIGGILVGLALIATIVFAVLVFLFGVAVVGFGAS